MLGLKIRSPATVIEGESYTVRLTVTNQSTKAGLPVEVLLGVGILAGTEFITLIPSQVSSEYFAPGETRNFDYTMVVPAGSGGQVGDIVAWVEDPTSRAIAQATEDVVIVAPVLPTYILVCRYMDIIDVDRIPFTEVSDRRAVMREPMRCSASATHFSFTLYWRLNTEMRFSVDGPRGIRFIGGFSYTWPDGTHRGSSYVSGTWRPYIPGVYIMGIFEARTGITYSWSDEAIGRFLPSGVPLTLMLNAKDPETMSSSYSGGNFHIENALVLT